MMKGVKIMNKKIIQFRRKLIDSYGKIQDNTKYNNSKCTLLIEKILISNSYYKNKLTKKIENYERV